MTTESLYRLSGLALVLAFPLAVVGLLLHPAGHTTADQLGPWWVPAHLLYLVGAVLVALGLPGMYARQAERAGAPGLVGFVLTMLAVLSAADQMLFETVAVPVLATWAETAPLVAAGGGMDLGPLGPRAGLLGAGALLFGVAVLRSGVLPRPVGWLLVAGVLVRVAGVVVLPQTREALPYLLRPVPVGTFLLFLGLAWGGRALLARDRPAPAPKPFPAAAHGAR